MRGLIVPVPDATASIKGKQVLPADASLTNKGLIEIATTPETASGASASLAIAPLGLLSAQGFSDIYESALQTITTGGTLTLAHGIGRTPKFVQVSLYCAIAEHGYSVGDVVQLNGSFMYSSTVNDTRGVAVVANSSNLVVRFSNKATVFTVLNKNTGALNNCTNAKWRVYFKAWG